TFMSLAPGRRSSSGQRRDGFFNVCVSRRQVKQTLCSDSHGIRPPAPEQYLTPLQQKEVCIRHLRSRLRDNVERLQHRDCEIDELRTQLYRMQEDWIEEECHRVEAQLALKEARKEIQLLQEVVESVRTGPGAREHDPHDHRPYSGLQAARPVGRSRSCGCSPASTLSRGAACTRRSSEALQLEQRSSNATEASAAPRTHLLLDAALLTEQLPPKGHVRGPPPVPRSSTYERLCSRHRAAGVTLLSHAERQLQVQRTLVPPPPSPVPALASGGAPGYGGELHSCRPPGSRPPGSRPPGSMPPPVRQEATVLQVEEDDVEEDEEAVAPPLCHWSRYFLVDLLALAMPVVPAVAWLCRGAPRGVVPVYHIGSLLRGCCAVALHSLRRQAAGGGRRSTGGSETTTI
uniref:Syntaphilin a n=1 Tax=Scophthalmus maximus TaxID=52904 RepID=A0A8D3C107_SCOMX